ncbi:MAG: C40 family peptidase [Candidatus Sumerlaeaceae bacterium]|nr:C40 family peptidase [Candidatus Sumerlaeaceae bacterium]
MIIRLKAIMFFMACLFLFQLPLYAQPPAPVGQSESLSSSPIITNSDASTDFLSDDQWRQLPRQERQGRFRRAFLSRLEPAGQPAAERLEQYIQRYKDIVVFDNRLGVFNVRAALLDKTSWTVQLQGEVSLAQYAQGLVNALQALGFHVASNTVEILPHKCLGKEFYGISTTMAATMRREPRLTAEQVNSVALGWPIRLLRPARHDDLTTFARNEAAQRWARRHRANGMGLAERADAPDVGEWFLAQSAEGYVGFVRGNEFRRLDHYDLPDGILGEPTTVPVTRDESMVVPMGAGLYQKALSWEIPFADSWLSFVPEKKRPELLPFAITDTRIIEITRPLMGTRYVWGGVTEQGIDCSGFTQLVYRMLGVNLPRDAEEQAIVGSIVAFGPDVISHAKPGDLIFFVNDYGRISHVAISLGGERIIHSSQRDVHISTLYETREDSSARLLDRVLYARRPAGLHVMRAKRATEVN